MNNNTSRITGKHVKIKLNGELMRARTQRKLRALLMCLNIYNNLKRGVRRVRSHYRRVELPGFSL